MDVTLIGFGTDESRIHRADYGPGGRGATFRGRLAATPRVWCARRAAAAPADGSARAGYRPAGRPGPATARPVGQGRLPPGQVQQVVKDLAERGNDEGQVALTGQQ